MYEIDNFANDLVKILETLKRRFFYLLQNHLTYAKLYIMKDRQVCL